MKDLTPQQKETLLGKIKSFLSITWTDTNTDNALWDYAVESILTLDNIAGEELDYLFESVQPSPSNTYISMCAIARDLLLNRVFYINEKALDDFAKNYRGELNHLYLLGKIYASEE